MRLVGLVLCQGDLLQLTVVRQIDGHRLALVMQRDFALAEVELTLLGGLLGVDKVSAVAGDVCPAALAAARGISHGDAAAGVPVQSPSGGQPLPKNANPLVNPGAILKNLFR